MVAIAARVDRMSETEYLRRASDPEPGARERETRTRPGKRAAVGLNTHGERALNAHTRHVMT